VPLVLPLLVMVLLLGPLRILAESSVVTPFVHTVS
jgi:hypothetical protein